jgi:4-diphosphocytidyl-2-C-methyl-D-erythritol kinase
VSAPVSFAPGDARAACVAAQAKLNLLLRITGRTAHDYHALYTIFQLVALSDTVTIRVGGPTRALDCTGADVGPVEENLAWRAAVAFCDATGWDTGFEIAVEKRIPVGGGMGGGSADAAAVLRILNTLAPKPLTIGPMLSLGELIGADVPFLILGHPTALGTGTGATLMPLLPLPERAVVLERPGFSVSSADAFGWFAGDRGERPYSRIPAPLPYPLTWAAVAHEAANDLEAPVFARHPALAERRQALEAAGADIARMTGSGSTLFGVFTDADRADRAAAASPAERLLTKTVSEVAPVEVIA